MNENKMEWNISDHIGVFKNVYPEGFCEHIVNEFEYAINSGQAYTRQQTENAPKMYKDDHQLLYDGRFNIFKAFEKNGHSVKVYDGFFGGLTDCMSRYLEEYSQLREYNLRAFHCKLQRTSPGGGYHIWHSEDNGFATAGPRILTYMLYLNTLENDEGGETEFLYQKLRIKPEKNTMLIWPAHYTHVHRGGMVLGKNYKYVATGWFFNVPT